MSKVNVVFVDDEINILNSINRITVQENFKSLFAGSGEKALELFRENEIGVIVTDMKMPQMNGLELLEKVKEISPNTIRMVLSGFAQISQVVATVNKVGVFKYITKPWNNEEEFLPAIYEAIHYYNLAIENELFKVQIEEKNKLYKRILDNNTKLIKNSEDDIKSIKTISKKIFDLKNTLNKKEDRENESGLKSTYLLDLIDKIYFEYLDTIPSSIERFNLEYFQDKFKELEEKKLTLIFENKNTINSSYLGDKEVFKLVLNGLINVISHDCLSEEIVLNFNNNNNVLNINFLIRNKINFQKIIESTEDKILLNILDDISKKFGGKLNIIPEKYLISVNTNLKIIE